MLVSRIEESRIAQPPEENFWQDFCLLSFVLCSAFLFLAFSGWAMGWALFQLPVQSSVFSVQFS